MDRAGWRRLVSVALSGLLRNSLCRSGLRGIALLLPFFTYIQGMERSGGIEALGTGEVWRCRGIGGACEADACLGAYGLYDLCSMVVSIWTWFQLQ